MNRRQRTALDWHGRLSVEALNRRFWHTGTGGLSVVLTVNSGYE